MAAITKIISKFAGGYEQDLCHTQQQQTLYSKH